MSQDMLVFLLVVGARFLVPLAIPRYPLVIIVALILDAVDQTVFQTLTTLPLEGYQGYDKALDIYYLTIAYLSTLRNWTSLAAFQVSMFLFYYRLVGVALFEFSQVRALLLFFPNTFEYFFIFYEAVRLRWNPRKLSTAFWILAAWFIWVFIKVPQEYWIHIAQLDTTDLIHQYFGDNMTAFYAIVAAAIAALLVVSWWLFTKKLPPADHALSLRADDNTELVDRSRIAAARIADMKAVFDRELLEKVVLLTLLVAIFGSVLGQQSTLTETAVSVALIMTVNTIISAALRRSGWRSIAREAAIMTVVNVGTIAGFAWLRPERQAPIDWVLVVFWALLMTVIVVLYDHYRVVHRARFGEAG